MRTRERHGYDAHFRACNLAVVRTVHLVLTAGMAAEHVAQETFYGLLKRWRTVSTYDLPTPTGRRRARALADAAPAVVLHPPAHAIGSRSSSRRGDGVSARPIRVVCAHTGMEL